MSRPLRPRVAPWGFLAPALALFVTFLLIPIGYAIYLSVVQLKVAGGAYGVRRKVFAFADAVVASSYFPLRAMSYVGVATSIIGFLYAIILLTLRIFRIVEVQGWASMMIVTLVLGGMQMLMLGIIGEYLWRTKESAQRQPLFLIEDAVDQSQPIEIDQ